MTYEVILISNNVYEIAKMDATKLFDNRNGATWIRMYIWVESRRYKLERVSENKKRAWYNRVPLSH